MKTFSAFLLTFFVALTPAIIVTSCSTPGYLAKTSGGKVIDTRLVGDWEGSEEDNQLKGMTKHWQMQRTADGKFILNFNVTIEGESKPFTEKGSWWVKDGKFYELHDVSGKTDMYEYTILNESQVKFKTISLGIDHTNQEYEFIDTRVKK